MYVIESTDVRIFCEFYMYVFMPVLIQLAYVDLTSFNKIQHCDF